MLDFGVVQDVLVKDLIVETEQSIMGMVQESAAGDVEARRYIETLMNYQFRHIIDNIAECVGKGKDRLWVDPMAVVLKNSLLGVCNLYFDPPYSTIECNMRMLALYLWHMVEFHD